MNTYDVYACKDEKDSSLFSEGVIRCFGENVCVVTDTGAFIASVQPLNCDPEESGLVKIGTLEK